MSSAFGIRRVRRCIFLVPRVALGKLALNSGPYAAADHEFSARIEPPIRRARLAASRYARLAGTAALSATARRTAGATSVPSSSIARIILACGIDPTLSCIRKR